MRNDIENFRLKVVANMPGKTRTFFIEPAKVKAMQRIFSIGKNENIILAEDESSVQKLLDAMKNSKGKGIFLIMTEKFLGKGFPFDQLKKAGFVDGKDFLKGWELLSESNGEAFNSYSLVQSM